MRFILAVSTDEKISINGKLPWNIPHDLKWFKMNTFDSTVVMGYNTFKSLNFKPLKNRTNLIVSSRELSAKTISVDNIPADAWVIGGAQLIESVCKPGDIMYITHICVDVHDKDNVYIKLPLLKLLWKTQTFSNKYYFACYKVV